MTAILEGKTKRIVRLVPNGFLAEVFSKDDVTAGDGMRHDYIHGKGALSNRTTCNVFQFLLDNNVVPLAYQGMVGNDSFQAEYCTMLPLEVVGRWSAAGSYCLRNPNILPGSPFPQPVVECFYKTTKKRVGALHITCDDPLLVFTRDNVAQLLHPQDGSCVVDDLSAVIDPLTVALLHHLKPKLFFMTLKIARALRYAWQKVGGRLVDFKVEYGVNCDGGLRLADVIDCDSWRVDYSGQQISKQPYREGASPEELLRIYTLGETLTRKFLNCAWQE